MRVFNPIKRGVILLTLIIFVANLHAQGTDFNFTINPVNIGWGMNLSSSSTEGQITYDFLNLYVEHKMSKIGIELSPFNIWTNYRHSSYMMNFINIRLYYNFLDQWESAYKEEDRGGYSLLGPFISACYLMLENDKSLNINNFQIDIGLKALMMSDISMFRSSGIPVGLQMFGIEFGYRFNNLKNDYHHFYFNLSTDLVVLLAIFGYFYKRI
jgi:hypothetical protein